ncbi:MAG TPA: hypothetical protein VFQ01_10060 [Nocardioides sp.]|jgi:hypothetical protein|nr:hypothetical protein [Nocardioides sp.]
MTDLLDELDERLIAAGARWRAEQPPPPGVPVERLDDRLGGRHPWHVVAGAAAAALVIAGVTTAVTRSHTETGSPADTTGTPTVQATPHQNLLPNGVPWRDLPAGHPDVRHREHGKVVTPFDRVSATGTISGEVHPGDLLRFTAVLQSPTRLVLDPCPDFNIAFGRHAWHTWQLNCRQVPYRDRQGRPMLPPFRNVRFDMQVRVPDVRGEQKVLWTLVGPQQLPGFYGIVKVTAG